MTATVVLAPDSFKGSITAADACNALAAGWLDADPAAVIVSRPMADGGEGTLVAFQTAVPGAESVPVTVTGPDGIPVDATWLLLPPTDEAPGGTGVVELASTSGIELLRDGLRPHDAGTTGFGQAIASALRRGVSRLVLGVGSSASTDGGAGMLAAMGARVVGADGLAVPPGLRGLAGVSRVDTAPLLPLPPEGAVVLSDVTNPLLGATGATAVFGPQKGIVVSDLPAAEAAMTRWAGVLTTALPSADAAAPGAGAAGGTGFALQAWGARLVAGSAEVARLVGLAGALDCATVVVTGEGSFDAQSASGKAPAAVLSLAAARSVPVTLVAGRVTQDADTSAFAAVVSLTDLAGSGAAALADPVRWLRAAGADLARRSTPSS